MSYKNLIALQHGSYAKKALLPGETVAEFERLLDGVVADLQPEGTIGRRVLARTVAVALRDLGRVERMWASMFYAAHPIARNLKEDGWRGDRKPQ